MYLFHVFLFKSSHSCATLVSAVALRREGKGWTQVRELTSKPVKIWRQRRGLCCVWIIQWKTWKERKQLDQSQRGECSKEGTNKGWIWLRSAEEGLSGFNSRVVPCPLHWQLVPAICYCVVLLTSFLCSQCSYEKQRLFMKKDCLLCFSLWSPLRFAIVGLITLNKCPLLELSPPPPSSLLSNQLCNTAVLP